MTGEASKTAEVGCWVRVREQDETNDERYVLTETTNLRRNELGNDNPMGRAFRGAKPGDQVSFLGPVGEIKFEVLGVGRENE